MFPKQTNLATRGKTKLKSKSRNQNTSVKVKFLSTSVRVF